MTEVKLDALGIPVTLEVDPADHIGGIIATGDFYERDLLADAASRVHGGAAVDVGAHIGNHALFLAARGLAVTALEPYRPNLDRLMRNIALNTHLRPVQPEALAAGRRCGTGSVVPPRPGNSGTARIVPGDEVTVTTIDSLWLSDVTLIKVDVEGSAADVLAGAAHTLARDRPVVYAEGDRDDCLAMLPDGYRCFGRFGRTDTWGFWCD